jgi:hypothetical protein
MSGYILLHSTQAMLQYYSKRKIKNCFKKKKKTLFNSANTTWPKIHKLKDQKKNQEEFLLLKPAQELLNKAHLANI